MPISKLFIKLLRPDTSGTVRLFDVIDAEEVAAISAVSTTESTVILKSGEKITAAHDVQEIFNMLRDAINDLNYKERPRR